MKRLHFESIDSTNQYIKKNYLSLDHLAWVTATTQKEGRGRSTKIWYGNQDSLLASILIKEELSVDLISIIPLLAAKSLHQVLSKYNQSIEIKWPNDLLIEGKKIAGILVESVIIDNEFNAIIIGFGVNINHRDFPDIIKDYSTSLALKTDQTYDINQILFELNQEFIKSYEIFKKNHLEVIHYCNDHLAYKHKTISYIENNQAFQAKIKYVRNDGNLIVSRDNLNIPLMSGEITLLK